MKNFKFRIDDMTYVRWNFSGFHFKDFLYTSFNTKVQNAFDLTMHFKKALDRLLNNQNSTTETKTEVKELLEYLRLDIIKIFEKTDLCPVFSESPFHFEFQIFPRSEITAFRT